MLSVFCGTISLNRSQGPLGRPVNGGSTSIYLRLIMGAALNLISKSRWLLYHHDNTYSVHKIIIIIFHFHQSTVCTGDNPPLEEKRAVAGVFSITDLDEAVCYNLHWVNIKGIILFCSSLTGFSIRLRRQCWRNNWIKRIWVSHTMMRCTSRIVSLIYFCLSFGCMMIIMTEWSLLTQENSELHNTRTLCTLDR